MHFEELVVFVLGSGLGLLVVLLLHAMRIHVASRIGQPLYMVRPLSSATASAGKDRAIHAAGVRGDDVLIC